MTRLFSSSKLVGILLLGFASGLPLIMVLGNYTYWLAEAGVSVTHIGLLSCIGLPYALKFIWAPLFDSLDVPWLSEKVGSRRAWLCVIQVFLAIALITMGAIDPSTHLILNALAALCVSFFSASQDIVIDALRIEQLSEQEQAPGVAMTTNGYRIGVLFAGALSLTVAHWTSWAIAYSFIAACLLFGQLGAYLCGETKPRLYAELQKSFTRKILAPLQSFVRKSRWWEVLIFIIFFKLGHSYIDVMSGPFFEAMSFTKVEIATVTKLYGFCATLLGSFAGGWLILRIGLMPSLLATGILQSICPLCYWWLAKLGHSVSGLMLTITVDYFLSQMATIALVTYLGIICNKRYTASHYALFTSIAAFSRTTLGMMSGWYVAIQGWENFFMLSMLLSIPGILMVRRMQNSDWIPSRPPTTF